MKLFIPLIVVVTVASGAAVGAPAEMTGRSFLAQCDAARAMDIRYGLCIGFLQGVIAEYNSERERQNKPRCEPADMSIGAMTDALKLFGKEKPETLDGSAAALVESVVVEAGHCH